MPNASVRNTRVPFAARRAITSARGWPKVLWRPTLMTASWGAAASTKRRCGGGAAAVVRDLEQCHRVHHTGREHRFFAGRLRVPFEQRGRHAVLHRKHKRVVVARRGQVCVPGARRENGYLDRSPRDMIARAEVADGDSQAGSLSQQRCVERRLRIRLGGIADPELTRAKVFAGWRACRPYGPCAHA